jgi:N-terminal domain of reverse transcriptase
MTAKPTVQTASVAGAASHNLLEWHAIDWRRVHQNVRRLQARIVKAGYAAPCHKGVRKGLSRISGNGYVRFLEEGSTATPPPYSTRCGSRH